MSTAWAVRFRLEISQGGDCSLSQDLTGSTFALAVSEGKQRMRRRAVHALNSHTLRSIENLKKDEDEMLRGMAPTSGLQSNILTRDHKSINRRQPHFASTYDNFHALFLLLQQSKQFANIALTR